MVIYPIVSCVSAFVFTRQSQAKRAYSRQVYDSIVDTWSRLLNSAEQHRLLFQTPGRNVYLNDYLWSRLRLNPMKTEVMWLGASQQVSRINIGDIPTLSTTIVTLVSFSIQSWQCLLNCHCTLSIRILSTQTVTSIHPVAHIRKLLKHWFRRLYLAVWTTATRFSMDWPIMSWGDSSRCRMLQHASSPEPDVVTTDYITPVLSITLASCSAASVVQTRLFGAPGIVRSNAYLPGWWHPSRLRRQPTIPSVFLLWLHVRGAMYAQPLWRQKLWRCGPANLEQSAMWSANTWHMIRVVYSMFLWRLL